MKAETFFDNFEFLASAPNGVQKLRELILQMAVQGKLVPQDERDESAFILVEKIKAEKKRLIKEKKIAKTEPLSPVNSEEIGKVFPENWAYLRLGDSIDFQKGKRPETLSENDGKNPYIDIAAFEQGKYQFFSDDAKKLTLCDENNLLIVCDGSRSGLVGFGRKGILGSTLAKIDYFGLLEKLYLFYFLKSKFSTSLKNLSKSLISNTPQQFSFLTSF
ncbi:Uncharacterised protein [uncultured archaeon]|nr:Uncharacterised protein [uncultured archaeon]